MPSVFFSIPILIHTGYPAAISSFTVCKVIFFVSGPLYVHSAPKISVAILSKLYQSSRQATPYVGFFVLVNSESNSLLKYLTRNSFGVFGVVKVLSPTVLSTPVSPKYSIIIITLLMLQLRQSIEILIPLSITSYKVFPASAAASWEIKRSSQI